MNRFRFLWEALRHWWASLLLVEGIIGGWDTATQHIDILQLWAFPVINGMPIWAWLGVLGVSACGVVFEHSYRRVRDVQEELRQVHHQRSEGQAAHRSTANDLRVLIAEADDPEPFGANSKGAKRWLNQTVAVLDREGLGDTFLSALSLTRADLNRLLVTPMVPPTIRKALRLAGAYCEELDQKADPRE